jgi:hypothetical protein
MSGMDIDDGNSGVVHAPPKSETLFAKSDELSVAFYANLPVEVKQVLKNAGECVFCIDMGGFGLIVLEISMEIRIRVPLILSLASRSSYLREHVLYGSMLR